MAYKAYRYRVTARCRRSNAEVLAFFNSAAEAKEFSSRPDIANHGLVEGQFEVWTDAALNRMVMYQGCDTKPIKKW